VGDELVAGEAGEDDFGTLRRQNVAGPQGYVEV
jgi:hypothetical protein